MKSYSHLQGRREGGEFTPPEQQQPRSCTQFCGCVALQVRGRLETPGCSLLALSLSWMKLSDRHPGPFEQPKSKYIKDLGAFASCLLTLLPLEARAASPFGRAALREGTAGCRGHLPTQDMASPHTFTHVPSPALQKLPLLCVRHSLQTSSREGITPQRAAWLPQEGWEPCQLMAWHSYRWRETWD